MSKILVGCDPEIFVKKAGAFISAYGMIEGDKKHPQKVEKGAVQVDGMALEFNIDPASSEQEFVVNVQSVYNTICGMVRGFEVVATPVADFSEDYLKQQPMEALELGCDPDFNAWTQRANPRPDGSKPMRTASGHVHIGWADNEDKDSALHIARCQAVARQCDFFLALPSLFYDPITRRREMYGKAGAYRPKPYGVEYRTLSNAWLNSEKLIAWVYRATIAATESVMQGNSLSDKYGDIQNIINTSDKKAAEAILIAENIEICMG